MDREASLPGDATRREAVEFYLLDHRTLLGKAIDVGLLALNLIFVVVLVVETYTLGDQLQEMLWSIEVGIAVVFAVEYVLRLYGAENRLAEFLDGYTVVDLLSILPTLAVVLLPSVSGVGLTIGSLRVLRVVRVLRFYRFTEDEEFFFGTVTRGTLRATKLLLTVLTIFFVSAVLFYSVEHRVNPEIGNFGDAFYFTVVALTTVGFGDITPTTEAGRWITVSSILAAILLVPWQASRIVREWTNQEKVDVTCPECGLSYHDPDASHCKSCGHVIFQEYDSRR